MQKFRRKGNSTCNIGAGKPVADSCVARSVLPYNRVLIMTVSRRPFSAGLPNVSLRACPTKGATRDCANATYLVGALLGGDWLSVAPQLVVGPTPCEVCNKNLRIVSMLDHLP